MWGYKGGAYASVVYGDGKFEFYYLHCFTSELDTPTTFCAESSYIIVAPVVIKIFGARISPP